MLATKTARKIPSICKIAGSAALTATAAAGIFVLAASAPVTIDLDGEGFDVVTTNTAVAAKGGNGGGGNNGGGNNGGNAKGKGGNGGNGGNAGNGGGGRDKVSLDQGLPGVTVAVFTTEIKKRRPANDVAVLDDPHQAVSFYTELSAMSGKKITHRWSHKGSEKFSTSFDVLADHWQIWSTQLLPVDHIGEWKVEVIDQDGKVLETRTLEYQPQGVANIVRN